MKINQFGVCPFTGLAMICSFAITFTPICTFLFTIYDGNTCMTSSGHLRKFSLHLNRKNFVLGGNAKTLEGHLQLWQNKRPLDHYLLILRLFQWIISRFYILMNYFLCTFKLVIYLSMKLCHCNLCKVLGIRSWGSIKCRFCILHILIGSSLIMACLWVKIIYVVVFVFGTVFLIQVIDCNVNSGI